MITREPKRRKIMITFRLTKEELHIINKRCDDEGISREAWIRKQLLKKKGSDNDRNTE